MAYKTANGTDQNRNELVVAIYTDTQSGNPDPRVTFDSRLYFTDSKAEAQLLIELINSN